MDTTDLKIKLFGIILIMLAIMGIAAVIYIQSINPSDPMIIQWESSQCLQQIVGNCIVK